MHTALVLQRLARIFFAVRVVLAAAMAWGIYRVTSLIAARFNVPVAIKWIVVILGTVFGWFFTIVIILVLMVAFSQIESWRHPLPGPGGVVGKKEKTHRN